MSVGFSIKVMFVDGRVEHHDFSQARTVVGSSPDADLYLPLEEISERHVLLAPRQGACWVSVARNVPVPVLLAGVAVDNQEIPWGTELDIGTVTLRIGEPTETAQKREKKHLRWLYLASAAMLLLAAMWLLQRQPMYPPKQVASAPELFGAGQQECSAAPEAGLTQASELRRAAQNYWQRYPFDSQEGIRAVRFFDRAAACFAREGETTLASDAHSQAEASRAVVERDYRSAQLQLSRALLNREHETALNYVNSLVRLTAHVSGEYSQWLRRVSSYLSQQTEEL